MPAARPKLDDDEVLKAACALVMTDLEREFPKVFPGRRERFIAEIFAAVKGWKIDDGYRIAKVLERDFGWVPDTAMAVTLHTFAGHAQTALRQAILRWVEEAGVKPQFKHGDRIWLPASLVLVKEWEGSRVASQIVNVDEKLAEYTVVALSALPVVVGTQASCLPFEVVEGAATVIPLT